MHLSDVETPCIIVDVNRLDANIQRMAHMAAAHDVSLRPHVKTHKMPDIAKKQMAAGAVGITVAKLSEAEVMAEHGLSHIFIAFPFVSPSKIARAIQLSRNIDLIVAVDSLEGAYALSAICKMSNHTLNVRLEIDTGLQRTGVLYEDALRLATQIQQLDNLKLTGIYTYRGALLDGKPTLDLESAGKQEGQLMVELADQLRSNGIPIVDVSVGSTPTAHYASRVKGVTEVRPGTYVFQDRMQAAYGVCSLEDCAASVLATVISRPTKQLAIIDGGSKTFATDVQPNVNPLLLKGFGHILGSTDALLGRMNEEHGMVTLNEQHTWKIGDRVHIIPNHICSTVNLHNKVYFSSGDGLVEVAVAGRGMLE